LKSVVEHQVKIVEGDVDGCWRSMCGYVVVGVAGFQHTGG
jgi:hypothetical protein